MGTHIAKLRLKNWKCFAGDVELELKPQVYAIVARLQNDSESSNWLGKSSLGEAIRYALTGYLPDHVRTEDEWITRGAPTGEVELILSTGDRILRSRHRGQSTKVYWNTKAMQAEAETKIGEMLRLTDEDFINTCYFEQKQLARIVTEKAADRLRIVSGWMELEPLQQMHGWVAAQLGRLEKDIVSARASALVCRQTVDQTVEQLRIPAGAVLVPSEASEPTWFEERKRALDVEIARAEEELGAVEGAMLGLNAIQDMRGHAERYAGLVQELATLKQIVTPEAGAALKRVLEEWRKKVTEVAERRGILQREVASRDRLLTQGFDGRCPVLCDECPVPDHVNEHLGKNRRAAEAARKKFGAVDEEYQVAAQNQTLAHDQLLVYERSFTKLREKEQEAARLRPIAEQYAVAIEQVQAPENVTAEMQRMRARLEELRAEHRTVHTYGEAVDKAADQLMEWDEKVEHLEDEAATYREALVLLGPTGAQRRIAEGALTQIEREANVLLTRSDIPLNVRMEWSREGGDIAKTCSKCGAPFPRSAKVKECARCGGARGQNIINKLEVRLSNWSGAAADLGGAAIQLAASAWLRRKRGSTWSTAILDEPFGSLDTAKRRAFAAHLVTMLGGEYAFEQSFIIAHHASVLDALPGRIEITSDGERSTASVVA